MTQKPEKFKDLEKLVGSTFCATALSAGSLVSYVNERPYLAGVIGVLAILEVVEAIKCYYKTKNKL
ncbi:MAG: hypothetical protein ABIJ20_00920 [Nanoarchaeota archaeon]|nr:hypothetical protein [Nanoarchaeota archaeon]MBU1445207.1 hypothetical protein [Nanoarchaeota archaeon]MBU2420291.1 hypothetical protein [Nanoarchaeota archaeon]MBU2475313.1 hypothetical protein [Nanoarchaeota archaeon]